MHVEQLFHRISDTRMLKQVDALCTYDRCRYAHLRALLVALIEAFHYQEWLASKRP